MKFHLSATIAIYFLFTLLFSTLSIQASQDQNKNKNFTEKLLAQDLSKNLQPHTKTYLSDKKKNEQITTITELSISQELQQPTNSFLPKMKDSILILIINQFLTCKDMLVLRKACKVFQNLLQPNHDNIVTFRNYSPTRQMIETTIFWNDLKYFLNQNYHSAFHEMKIFNIKENQYAVLTRIEKEKIIIWNNNVTRYPQLLPETLLTNQQQHSSSNNLVSLKTTFTGDKGCYEMAWASITKEGNVTTGGDKNWGGDSSRVQFQLKNVKMICSTMTAFAALLGDGRVVAWGGRYAPGYRNPIKHDSAKVPSNLKPHWTKRWKCLSCFSWKQNCQDIKKVKMIFSTTLAFSALLNDGRVVTWGHTNYGGDSRSVQSQLQNVKIIFSTSRAFAALLNDGCVVTWGQTSYGGDSRSVQSQLKNVKMIVSTTSSFAALLNDGRVVTWGFAIEGGNSSSVQFQLQNVKMIFSTYSAFAALLNDGQVVVWGNEPHGGKIPNELRLQNVKMIFSTFGAFAALLNDGRVVAWGHKNCGGHIPDPIQKQLKNVKIIFSTEHAFAALLESDNVVAWGNSNYGGQIPYNIKFKFIKTIIPKTRNFTAVCKDDEMITWPDLMQ